MNYYILILSILIMVCFTCNLYQTHQSEIKIKTMGYVSYMRASIWLNIHVIQLHHWQIRNWSQIKLFPRHPVVNVESLEHYV